MGIIKFTEKANACFYQTAELEKIAGGYYFTEGPVWDSVEKCLYFTNFQDNTIYRFKEREGTSLYAVIYVTTPYSINLKPHIWRLSLST